MTEPTEKTIIRKIEKSKDGTVFFVCSHPVDVRTLMMAASPTEMWDVTRMNGLYHIPSKIIEDRLKKMKKQVDILNNKIKECKKLKKSMMNGPQN